jgi:two-component system sensor histidine kinase UhpB
LKETPIVSLRARLVLSMGCVLALMLALGGVLTFWRAVHSVRVEMQSALAAARKTIANGVREVAGSPHVTLDLRDLVATFDGNRHVQARLEMVPSMLLAQSSLRVPERPVPSFLRHALEVPVADAVLELPADGNTLVLVLHADPTNEIGEVWEQAIDALALFGLFFVLLVLLINWSVGRALRPLSRLTTAFGRIGAGDHTTRVPAQGAAELAQLAAGFNLMAERLGQIVDDYYAWRRNYYPEDGVVVGSALVEAVRLSLVDGKATAKTVPAVTGLVGELIEGIRRIHKS